MAVTKQVYTANPTWTASALADLFKNAFIDAGLMTDWHDSFLNTVENRVLEVTYDGTKTYGKTYYWFQFTTTGVFVHIATGWNTTTKVPSGTQYVDFFSTTTNATTNHLQWVTLAAATQVDVIRYSSGVTGRTDFAWFVIRNGTTFANFHIAPPSSNRANWINLDQVCFHHIINAVLTTTTNYAQIDFANRLALRRSFWTGGALRGSTTIAHYSTNWTFTTQRYFAWGNANNTTNNWLSGTGAATGLALPLGFNNTNPAFATNSTPIFTELPYSLYLTSPFPEDFGVSGVYLASGMTPQDRLVVTSGSEEWEILVVANNATVSNDTASPVLVARAV